jgi:cytochrome P450
VSAPGSVAARATGSRLSLLSAVDPQVQARLYDFYDDLRADAACRWDRTLRAWVVTSYALAASAAVDPRLSSVRYPDVDAVPAELRPLVEVLSRQMLYRDPPDHTRLRALINRAFTARAVQRLRPGIEAAVDEAISAALPAGRMEIVSQLAYPLPMTVICDLLDIPPGDRPALRTQAAAIAAVLGNSRLTAQENLLAAQGCTALTDYFRELLPRQRAGSSPGLLAGLTPPAADGGGLPDGGPLPDEELLANAVLLLLAGHETTTHFLGNAVLALVQHPAHLRELVADPDLVPAAVEELMRFDSSVQMLLRRATMDLDLGGSAIRAGEVVLVAVGAANRDPAAFTDPHVLDFHRVGPRHLAFGHGAHFCVGAELARLESRIALHAIVTRLSGLRAAGSEPAWNRNLNFRGLTRLDVEFTPAPGAPAAPAPAG